MNLDINCDMGESYGDVIVGNDAAIMPYISSANIACGFHGGDPVTILKTIELAFKHGVAVGAHPGYHDLVNFGRTPMTLSSGELRSSILYQVGALKSMAESVGGRISHVKPHGAMYNAAASDLEMSRVIVGAVKEIDSSLFLYCMCGSKMEEAANEAGIRCVSEAFADRAYNEDGTLVSRSNPGAVFHDIETIIERVLLMVAEGVIESVTGKIIPVKADTICIHGDNEIAPELARELHTYLTYRGITITKPC
ncbi:MAG: 5-oxoprolinase subunit PxpA [Bacteroidales bacterium]